MRLGVQTSIHPTIFPTISNLSSDPSAPHFCPSFSNALQISLQAPRLRTFEDQVGAVGRTHGNLWAPELEVIVDVILIHDQPWSTHPAEAHDNTASLPPDERKCLYTSKILQISKCVGAPGVESYQILGLPGWHGCQLKLSATVSESPGRQVS